MRIRKWDGSAWTAISPKVTYTDVVADVTAGTPVSIFTGGKLKEAYLPDFLFGGMRFVDTIVSSDTLTAEAIMDRAQTYVSNNGGELEGCYFIVAGNAGQTVTISGGTDNNNGVVHTTAAEASNQAIEEDDVSFPVTLENGDWFVMGGQWTLSSTTYQRWGVVNNTYQTATSSVKGILKIESDTTQTVAANAVSATTGRTYGIQLNSSGQAVVNVPWTDTDTNTNTTYTTSAVDSGANAIIRLTGSDSSTEDVTLVAGSNMTITPSGDNITLASAHPSISAASSVNNSGRTYIQDITLDSNGHITGITSATETVTNTDTNTVTSIRRDNTGTYRTGNINLVGGSNVTITETSTGVFSFASTDTNTNTTYSAGNGISLSGTTFSVAGGVGLTQEASGLKSTYPVAVSSSEPASGFRVTNGALWFDLS